MELNRAPAWVAAAEIILEFHGLRMWLCRVDKVFKASLALPRADHQSREDVGCPGNCLVNGEVNSEAFETKELLK